MLATLWKAANQMQLLVIECEELPGDWLRSHEFSLAIARQRCEAFEVPISEKSDYSRSISPKSMRAQAIRHPKRFKQSCVVCE